MSLLEAARWAPSAYNEQPWQYVVGYKGYKTHQKLSEILFQGNFWAKKAGILMLSITKNFFDYNHKPNPDCLHDLGMATMNLVLQATEMDLISHQMSGYDQDKARTFFNIGSDYELSSMIAVGYPCVAQSQPIKGRDEALRERKDINDLIWEYNS